jgi:hypothetical protein
VRVEVLLAGATAPEPLPVHDLVEVDLWDQLPGLTELKEHLSLIYTPAYDPDANRIEWRCAHLATGRDT